MAIPPNLIYGMAGVAAVAGAATYFAVQSPEPPTQDEQATPGADRQRPAGDEVTVCVRLADGVLRVPVGFGTQCPPGHAPFELPEEDEQVCDLCDPYDEPPPARKGDAISQLEERIAKLEKPVYFEVVTPEDKRPILRITSNLVSFFDPSGAKPVGAVGTGPMGAYFTARSTAGGLEASIGASGLRAGVLTFEQGVQRAELGTRSGPFGLRFPSGDGLIAGIGQSRARSGAVVVGTLLGQVSASMMVPQERGAIALGRAPASTVAVFGEATIGGGVMDLGNPRGDSMVKMGHNGHKYGIVMTGPVLGIPYVPRTGIPGSYFVGCADGGSPSCLPEVAGR